MAPPNPPPLPSLFFSGDVTVAAAAAADTDSNTTTTTTPSITTTTTTGVLNNPVMAQKEEGDGGNLLPDDEKKATNITATSDQYFSSVVVGDSTTASIAEDVIAAKAAMAASTAVAAAAAAAAAATTTASTVTTDADNGDDNNIKDHDFALGDHYLDDVDDMLLSYHDDDDDQQNAPALNTTTTSTDGGEGLSKTTMKVKIKLTSVGVNSASTAAGRSSMRTPTPTITSDQTMMMSSTSSPGGSVSASAFDKQQQRRIDSSPSVDPRLRTRASATSLRQILSPGGEGVEGTPKEGAGEDEHKLGIVGGIADINNDDVLWCVGELQQQQQQQQQRQKSKKEDVIPRGGRGKNSIKLKQSVDDKKDVGGAGDDGRHNQRPSATKPITPIPPPKRKRGRPPKIPPPVAAVVAGAEGAGLTNKAHQPSALTLAPPKRKRGRPPKIRPPVAVEGAAVVGQVGAAGGVYDVSRQQAKKKEDSLNSDGSTIQPTGSTTPITTTSPKRRGRPPKKKKQLPNNDASIGSVATSAPVPAPASAPTPDTATTTTTTPPSSEVEEQKLPAESMAALAMEAPDFIGSSNDNSNSSGTMSGMSIIGRRSPSTRTKRQPARFQDRIDVDFDHAKIRKAISLHNPNSDNNNSSNNEIIVAPPTSSASTVAVQEGTSVTMTIETGETATAVGIVVEGAPAITSGAETIGEAATPVASSSGIAKADEEDGGSVRKSTNTSTTCAVGGGGGMDTSNAVVEITEPRDSDVLFFPSGCDNDDDLLRQQNHKGNRRFRDAIMPLCDDFCRDAKEPIKAIIRRVVKGDDDKDNAGNATAGERGRFLEKLDNKDAKDGEGGGAVEQFVEVTDPRRICELVKRAFRDEIRKRKRMKGQPQQEGSGNPSTSASMTATMTANTEESKGDEQNNEVEEDEQQHDEPSSQADCSLSVEEQKSTPVNSATTSTEVEEKDDEDSHNEDKALLETQPLAEIYPNDVLMGTKPSCMGHKGNIYLYQAILKHRIEYHRNTVTSHEKMRIIQDMISAVLSNGGRFLGNRAAMALSSSTEAASSWSSLSRPWAVSNDRWYAVTPLPQGSEDKSNSDNDKNEIIHFVSSTFQQVATRSSLPPSRRERHMAGTTNTFSKTSNVLVANPSPLLDVMIGRGREFASNPGNAYYSEQVVSRLRSYQKTFNDRDTRRACIWDVVDAIEERGGRFLVPVSSSENAASRKGSGGGGGSWVAVVDDARLETIVGRKFRAFSGKMTSAVVVAAEAAVSSANDNDPTETSRQQDEDEQQQPEPSASSTGKARTHVDGTNGGGDHGGGWRENEDEGDRAEDGDQGEGRDDCDSNEVIHGDFDIVDKGEDDDDEEDGEDDKDDDEDYLDDDDDEEEEEEDEDEEEEEDGDNDDAKKKKSRRDSGCKGRVEQVKKAKAIVKKKQECMHVSTATDDDGRLRREEAEGDNDTTLTKMSNLTATGGIVHVPSPVDVLVGRDKTNRLHAGNIHLNDLMRQRCMEYKTCRDRPTLFQSVMDHVCMERGGHFLEAVGGGDRDRGGDHKDGRRTTQQYRIIDSETDRIHNIIGCALRRNYDDLRRRQGGREASGTKKKKHFIDDCYARRRSSGGKKRKRCVESQIGASQHQSRLSCPGTLGHESRREPLPTSLREQRAGLKQVRVIVMMGSDTSTTVGEGEGTGRWVPFTLTAIMPDSKGIDELDRKHDDGVVLPAIRSNNEQIFARNSGSATIKSNNLFHCDRPTEVDVLIGKEYYREGHAGNMFFLNALIERLPQYRDAVNKAEFGDTMIAVIHGERRGRFLEKNRGCNGGGWKVVHERKRLRKIISSAFRRLVSTPNPTKFLSSPATESMVSTSSKAPSDDGDGREFENNHAAAIIQAPASTDLLIESEGTNRDHPGNIYFQQIVKQYASRRNGEIGEEEISGKRKTSRIIDTIVSSVRKNGGRFLERRTKGQRRKGGDREEADGSDDVREELLGWIEITEIKRIRDLISCALQRCGHETAKTPAKTSEDNYGEIITEAQRPSQAAAGEASSKESSESTKHNVGNEEGEFSSWKDGDSVANHLATGLAFVKDPTDVDVLIGNDTGNVENVGNIKYLSDLAKFAEAYHNDGAHAVVAKVVDAVAERGGRFLMSRPVVDRHGGAGTISASWQVANDTHVHEAVTEALKRYLVNEPKRLDKNERPNTLSVPVERYTKKDVLIGHPGSRGNVGLQRLVAASLDDYRNAEWRREVTYSIIKMVEDRGGRFLERKGGGSNKSSNADVSDGDVDADEKKKWYTVGNSKRIELFVKSLFQQSLAKEKGPGSVDEYDDETKLDAGANSKKGNDVDYGEGRTSVPSEALDTSEAVEQQAAVSQRRRSSVQGKDHKTATQLQNTEGGFDLTNSKETYIRKKFCTHDEPRSSGDENEEADVAAGGGTDDEKSVVEPENLETDVEEGEEEQAHCTDDEITNPRHNDVVFAKGMHGGWHSGNVRFKELCAERAPDYYNSDRKICIVNEIRRVVVDEWKGRFLTRDGNGNHHSNAHNLPWRKIPDPCNAKPVEVYTRRTIRRIISAMQSNGTFLSSRSDKTLPMTHNPPAGLRKRVKQQPVLLKKRKQQRREYYGDDEEQEVRLQRQEVEEYDEGEVDNSEESDSDDASSSSSSLSVFVESDVELIVEEEQETHQGEDPGSVGIDQKAESPPKSLMNDDGVGRRRISERAAKADARARLAYIAMPVERYALKASPAAKPQIRRSRDEKNPREGVANPSGVVASENPLDAEEEHKIQQRLGHGKRYRDGDDDYYLYFRRASRKMRRRKGASQDEDDEVYAQMFADLEAEAALALEEMRAQ